MWSWRVLQPVATAATAAPLLRLRRSDECQEEDAPVDCAACVAKAARIFCGGEHTLLRDPRTLEVYQLGACGLGFDHDDAKAATDPRSYASQLPLPGPASAVFAGRYHNFARLNGGRCYSYGCGRQAPNDGQLLNGSHDEHIWPAQTQQRFSHAALGGHHSVVRTRAGAVLSCGAGWQGQMGNGTLDYKNAAAVEVPGLPRVARVASGYYHTAALTEDGECFVWGCNEQGQLGRLDAQVLRPQRIQAGAAELEGLRIADFAGGYGHSLLRTDRGRVFTLGNHGEGQRALDPEADAAPVISELQLPGAAEAVAAGNHHSLVLVDGGVWAFGSDEFGQEHANASKVSGEAISQDEDSDHIWRPRRVTGLPADDPVVRIDAGMYHSAAQTASGRIFVWGCGSNGQTGDGTLPDRTGVTELDLAAVARACAARPTDSSE